MKSKLITKADIILAVVLLVLGLGSPFLMQKKTGGEKTVVISIDGEESGRYPLSGNTVLGVWPDPGENNKYSMVETIYLNAYYPENFWGNLIVIENGSVCVTHANCKGNDCVRTGKISKEGQIIACLPHRLLISIEASEEGPDVVLK